MSKYLLRRFDAAPEVLHSVCGQSTRLLTSRDSSAVSFHVVHILDGKTHYHKNSTEVYYILEGKGKLELDGEIVEVEPGCAVLIPPGVRHRGFGDFRTIVVGAPAFQLEDEYAD